MSDEQDPAAAPSKVDPETLAIRTQPTPAIRFRRGLIVTIAAFASASLIAVTWVALKPRAFHGPSDVPDLSGPAPAASPEALATAPASYADVPRLGPPLPGDLGRPILEHQRALAAGTKVDPVQQAAVQERERRLAALRTARESEVIFGRRGGPTGGASPPAAAAPATSLPAEVAPPSPVVSTDERSQPRPAGAGSDHLLSAGSIIPASLVTGLNSDLPGIVVAQVTSPVYDSATGRVLLIPQGARLIGRCDSVVAFGQQRALVVWQRIVLPDGRSITIDNAPASDPAGYTGLTDEVDFHTWSLLKGIALATLLGVGSELSVSGESDLVQAIREATQQNASRAAGQFTSRALDIKPTITVRPGARVSLVVHKDLVLTAWRQAGD